MNGTTSTGEREERVTPIFPLSSAKRRIVQFSLLLLRRCRVSPCLSRKRRNLSRFFLIIKGAPYVQGRLALIPSRPSSKRSELRLVSRRARNSFLQLTSLAVRYLFGVMSGIWGKFRFKVIERKLKQNFNFKYHNTKRIAKFQNLYVNYLKRYSKLDCLPEFTVSLCSLKINLEIIEYR